MACEVRFGGYDEGVASGDVPDAVHGHFRIADTPVGALTLRHEFRSMQQAGHLSKPLNAD